MQIGRKGKFIKIAHLDDGAPRTYFFTEVDDLEKAIEALQAMLKYWRDELELRPREEEDEQ